MIRINFFRIRTLVCLASGAWFFFLFGAGTPALAQQAAAYQDFKALTATLHELVKTHPQTAGLEPLAKTIEGREVWLLTIGKKTGVPFTERPGILVVANLEGNQVAGSTLAVGMASYLLSNYGGDDAVKTGLDQYVFYVIPRLNPDGAEDMFAAVKTGRKTNATPFDGDNDGRMDEDGPDDLNKDGVITMMRVRDDFGLYVVDPENPKLMKKADAAKGERGLYSIYWEGIDNDGDGFINEDPAGGTDLNRNFQHAYPYYKEDAGMNMIGETETRALMDWVLANRNISMILTFGESDNLITPPNSRGQLASDRGLDLVAFANASMAGASKTGMMATGGRGMGRFGGMFGGGFPGGRGGQADESAGARSQRQASQPVMTFQTADLPYFTKVSEHYRELTGIKTQPVLRNPEGAFFQFGYFQYGVPSFITPGWGILLPEDTTTRRGGAGMRRPGGTEMPAGAPGAAAAPAASAGIDVQFLKFLESRNPDGFKDWGTYMHPDMGEVEIGGFSSAAIHTPPVQMIQDLVKPHAEFALWMTTLNAKVAIDKTEVIDQGGGLFRIKAEVVNEGFLPTAIRHGVVSRSVKPVMVQIGVDQKQIIAGHNKTNFIQSLDGSGGRQKFEWLVKAKKGEQVELKVVSQKAGSANTTLTLK